MKKSKVNILLYFPFNKAMTGAVKHLLTLLDNLDRNLYCPLVVTQRKSQLMDEVKKRGIEIIHLPLPGLLDLQDGQVLRYNIFDKLKSVLSLFGYNNSIIKIIKNRHIDLIWTRNVKAVMFVGLACQLSRKPLIWDVGLEPESKGLVKILHFIGLSLTSLVVTQGLSQPKQVFGKTLTGLFRKKLKTISPGIDSATIQKIEQLLANSTQPHQNFNILSVGIVGKRKNQMMLVKAVHRLSQSYPNIKTVVIGPIRDEDYYQKICDYIKKNQLQTYIEFLGWRDDIPEFLVKADVFVLCSENEGVPRAIREALFAKLPVIATRAGGIPDAIAHEETGFLVKLNDVNELEKRLKYFIDNPASREAMGEAAYQLGREKFSLDAWANQYNRLMISLV